MKPSGFSKTPRSFMGYALNELCFAKHVSPPGSTGMQYLDAALDAVRAYLAATGPRSARQVAWEPDRGRMVLKVEWEPGRRLIAATVQYQGHGVARPWLWRVWLPEGELFGEDTCNLEDDARAAAASGLHDAGYGDVSVM